MNHTLTKPETSLLKWVLRPWWPKFAICNIIALAICGLVLLGLSIRELVWLRSDDGTMTVIGMTNTLARGCAYLGFAGIFLISAVWGCLVRFYGLLVRKLAGKDEIQQERLPLKEDAGTNIRHRCWSFGVLAAGIITTSVAGIIPTLRLGFWSLPHWSVYVAYLLIGMAVALAQTEPERRCLFRVSLALALLSTLLALDLTFLLLDLPLTKVQGAHHSLVLDYVIPLATLAIGIPSFLIVLGRRVFRHAPWPPAS